MTTVRVALEDPEFMIIVFTFDKIWSFVDYQAALEQAGELAREHQRRPILIHDVPTGIRLPDNYVSRMGALISGSVVIGTLMVVVVVRDLLGQRMMETVMNYYEDAHPNYALYTVTSLEEAYALIRAEYDLLNME